jgi:hypothetical protein
METSSPVVETHSNNTFSCIRTSLLDSRNMLNQYYVTELLLIAKLALRINIMGLIRF